MRVEALCLGFGKRRWYHEVPKAEESNELVKESMVGNFHTYCNWQSIWKVRPKNFIMIRLDLGIRENFKEE